MVTFSGVGPLADQPAITEDTLMGGAVTLRQPRDGYRAAIDPVLLAAAVPAADGERVYEPGAGTGAASLCLARRVEGCRVTGLEVQPALVRLAGKNVRLNGLHGRVEIMVGDMAKPLPPRVSGGFDHVMMNPPHQREGAGHAPPDDAKALANVERGDGLAGWIETALSRLRPKGMLTLIHRADRLDELCGLLHGRAGEMVVFPLWPAPGKPAGRIIVQARKGIATPLRLAPGLLLHGADGSYTVAADAILRGAGLNL